MGRDATVYSSFFVLVGGAVDRKSWRDKSIDNKAKPNADKHEAIDKAEDEDDPPKDKDKDEAIEDDPNKKVTTPTRSVADPLIKELQGLEKNYNNSLGKAKTLLRTVHKADNKRSLELGE